MLRPRHIVLLIAAVFLLASPAMAQAQDEESEHRENIKLLSPTWRGSTGLFNLYSAETLRQGEVSFGFHTTKFHRDPGDIDIHLFPVSVSIGLFDRLELFGSYEVHKRVNADAIMVNKVLPGAPLEPMRLSNGLLAFYNDTPFMDVGFGDGAGDLWAGLKLNLVSEHRGGPFSLAVQPIARFHLTDKRTHMLRGLTSGVTDAGFDMIFSKNYRGGGTFVGNAGFLFADDIAGVDRQPRFNWGIGIDQPLGSQRARLIGELLGSVFYGSRRTTDFTNVRSPVDTYVGLRVHPSNWVAISGAYNYHMNVLDEAVIGVPATDRHGFLAQVAIQRKVNRPPTVECSADPTTVTQGESATINIRAFDPDDDNLQVTWRSSAGTLTQRDNSAVLDTTGVTPGRHTVNVEVTDGEHVATCSVDITVEKLRRPPTIACEPSNVTVTEGESATLQARASDPDGDPLRFEWTVNGQGVNNDSPSFEFGTVGRDPGSYTVRVTVHDTADNLSANCEFNVTVERRPNRPPVVTLTLDKTEVFAGEIVTATADASDPDGDPITYSWTVDGQSRPETSATLAINTSGMTGGSHSVTVTVRDDRGGEASDTKTFRVVEKIVIQIDRIQPDNRAKALLDEVALRMQQNPALRARITGHTDDRGSEAANVRVGQRRAEAVRDYLVQQHNIDTGRIDVASAGESQPIADNATAEGRTQNRRVEIELFVP